MAIRYKVVTGINSSLYAYGKYNITYHPGEIVEACPNTIGIYVFKKLDQAEKYQQKNNVGWGNKIIKLESIGRGVNAPWAPSYYSPNSIDRVNDLKKQYLKVCNQELRPSILNYFIGDKRLEGLMLYQKVKVIGGI